MSQIPRNISGEPVPNVPRDPPKDTPFTLAELAEYDGSDQSRPIYVAVKGTVFDVTGKRPLYGMGGTYHSFAGKDASKGLATGSMTDVAGDCSSLNESQLKTLDDWYKYYELRYNIVGKVTS